MVSMWAFVKSFFFKSEDKKMVPVGIGYYTGPEEPLEEIEAHLLEFTGGTIDLEMDESGIATLCINHYKKRNAISGAMMVQLRAAVHRLERWPAGRAVLLLGAGGCFCAGGDLDMARASPGAEPAYRMARYMQHVLGRLQRLPLLSAALIEGPGALGGGAELALACDFRLVSADARGLGLVHARMGLSPAWGGAARLVALLGYPRALDLLATARVLRPAEALAAGLADALLPAGAAAPAAARAWLAQRALQHPAAAVRAAKAAAMAASPDCEARIFAPLWGAPDNARALRERVRHCDPPPPPPAS